MTIGENIKQLREKRSLSQRKLAIAISVSNTTINSIENDKTLPSVSLILKLSDFFGCTTDEILKN